MAGEDPVGRGRARQRLLDTAEALFADHGVDGVSLRQVNAAAGVSAGVLHYHFGSREVLLHELINRHLGEVMVESSRLLEPLQTMESPPLRGIVHALVSPLAKLATATDPAGPRYVRFLCRLHSDRPAVLEEAGARFSGVGTRLKELLHRAVPDKDPAEVDIKFAMAQHAMLQVLAHLTSPGRAGLPVAPEKVDNVGLTAMLVDFMSDGIGGSGGERNHG